MLSDWKKSLLLRLYHNLDYFYRHEELDNRALRLQSQVIHRFKGQQEAKKFFGNLPITYYRSVSSREYVGHFELYKRALKGQIAVDIHKQRKNDHVVITVASKDRQGLFAAIAGTLYLSGLNILNVQLFTTEDNKIAFDVIDAKPQSDRRPKLNQQILVDNLKAAIQSPKQLHQQVREQSQQQIKAQSRQPNIANQLKISNRQHANYTSLEIVTADRPGLLYSISSLLAKESVSIYLAKINTEANRVIDVFFIGVGDKRRKNKKITDVKKLARIRRAMKALLK